MTGFFSGSRRWAAVLAALAIGACSESSGSPSTEATTRGLLDQAPSVAQQSRQIDVATLGFDYGVDEAPVRVVEMSDFGCGYCRRFHMETLPTLMERFMDADKVQWKFMPFISGQFENSLVATEAAECALEQSPALFNTMNDRLWTDQQEWKPSDDPEAVVRAMAADAGVELQQFDACMAEDRTFERMAAATQLANQLGVRGTPTFFVVGYPPLQGALDTETFIEILDAVFEEVTSGENGG